jgi:hypothetical protein
MKPSHTPESLTQNCDRFVDEHRLLLEQAVEKLVRVAEQVGVTPEEIISLLDSGIGIRDLLAFLASKRSGLAMALQSSPKVPHTKP